MFTFLSTDSTTPTTFSSSIYLLLYLPCYQLKNQLKGRVVKVLHYNPCHPIASTPAPAPAPAPARPSSSQS